MGKKGKKGKKPPLTAAEKAALKAQKLLDEQEKARQAERDKLLRHMAVSSVNRKAIQRKYRDIIYRTQMPVLKQDVETMWHRFDFAVELKSYNIDCLVDEIDFDQMQNHYNQRDHTFAMDKLLLENERRLTDLRHWYEAQRHRLLAAGADFKRSAEEVQRRDEDDLGATLWRMRSEHDAATAAYRDDAEIRACEQHDEYGDVMNLMRATRERQLDKLWTGCHSVVADYRRDTAQRRAEYERLRQLDVDTTSERLADLYEEARELQQRLQLARSFQAERLGVLQKERDSYAALYTALMADKEAGTQADRQRATHLAVCSAAVTKKLEQLHQKAEQILNLTALCRKYETQEEKVDPFPKSTHEIQDATGDQPTGIEMLEQLQKTDDTLTMMERFWQGVAKVQMTYAELVLLHDHLMNENKELKHVLKSYFRETAHPTQIFSRSQSDGKSTL